MALLCADPRRTSSAHGVHELGEDAAGHQHVVVDDEQVRVVASQPPVVRLHAGTASSMGAPQTALGGQLSNGMHTPCTMRHMM